MNANALSLSYLDDLGLGDVSFNVHLRRVGKPNQDAFPPDELARFNQVAVSVVMDVGMNHLPCGRGRNRAPLDLFFDIVEFLERQFVNVTAPIHAGLRHSEVALQVVQSLLALEVLEDIDLGLRVVEFHLCLFGGKLVGFECHVSYEPLTIHSLTVLKRLSRLAKFLSRTIQRVAEFLPVPRQQSPHILFEIEFAGLQPGLRLDQSCFLLIAADLLFDQKLFQGTGIELDQEVTLFDVGSFRDCFEDVGEVEPARLDFTSDLHIRGAFDRTSLDKFVSEGAADGSAG